MTEYGMKEELRKNFIKVVYAWERFGKEALFSQIRFSCPVDK